MNRHDPINCVNYNSGLLNGTQKVRRFMIRIIDIVMIKREKRQEVPTEMPSEEFLSQLKKE